MISEKSRIHIAENILRQTVTDFRNYYFENGESHFDSLIEYFRELGVDIDHIMSLKSDKSLYDSDPDEL